MPKRKQDAETAGEEMVGLDGAAGILGVSRSTLQRMLKQGNVRGFKVGRQWRFRRSDLDKFGRMSHPSSAGVKVNEIDALAASVASREKGAGDVQFESSPSGFPASEEEASLDELLKRLLAEAVQHDASAIHIEPSRDATNVRLRIDGVLHHVLEMPRYAHKALIVCVKQHAGLALDQEQIAQDGRFRFTLDGTECDVRVATLPTIHGESAVMRLLPQVAQLLTLGSPALGMSTTDLERFRRLLHQPCGLLLVIGPSGCGKTSLLYAGLQDVASPEIRSITIEDPVEFGFRWVTQAPVNVKAGFTFEQAVRATARQDPDVIMIGELRSQSVADMAARLAMTGHLVMSVLHSSSAAGGIWRLLDMGVEPFALAESLICLVSMRLVRKVCGNCGAPDRPNSSVLTSLAARAKAGGYELPEHPSFRRGAGCDACRKSGYYGRTAIYEVMEVTPDIRRLIAARAPAEALREAAVRNGMTTLTADGLRKAAEGITSLTEVARLLPEEPS
jgi:type IV pilus assembly protein PilB